MAKHKSYKIVRGPSREELFDSLRLYGENRLLNFPVGRKIDGVIISFWVKLRKIEKSNDTDAHSWQLSAEVRKLDDDITISWSKSGFPGCIGILIQMKYSTKTRKGVVRIPMGLALWA